MSIAHGRRLYSVNNFDRDLLSGALRDRLYDGADLAGNATLTADQLAHILRRDPKLERRGLAFDLVYFIL